MSKDNWIDITLTVAQIITAIVLSSRSLRRKIQRTLLPTNPHENPLKKIQWSRWFGLVVAGGLLVISLLVAVLFIVELHPSFTNRFDRIQLIVCVLAIPIHLRFLVTALRHGRVPG
jgi:hypothetical protein